MGHRYLGVHVDIDHTIGNNADFNQAGFNKMLKYISLYGDDGPEGPKTLINVKTLQELKYDIFNEDQKADKGVRSNSLNTSHSLTHISLA